MAVTMRTAKVPKTYWALFKINKGELVWSTLDDFGLKYWYAEPTAARREDCRKWDGKVSMDDEPEEGIYIYVEVEEESY